MRISICAPSYKRPKVKTLKRYPRTRVYVANSELGAYLDANPDGSDIVGVPDEVQGNVCRIRNYILDTEFNAGADGVLIIDDDMESICRYDPVPAEFGDYGYGVTKLDMGQLEAFAESGSELCEEWGYKLWGVNCVLDPRAYRHSCPFSTVSYIGSPFSVHLRNPLRYEERFSLKEDYDLTLQHMNAYRGALRFNMYHYRCQQSEQAGGCANYRNMAEEKRQFEELQRKWGSKIIQMDKQSKQSFDYNPLMKIPIKGV